MKRTKRESSSPLTLHRETLRRLDAAELEGALGGGNSTTMLCPTITSVQCLVYSGDCRQ